MTSILLVQALLFADGGLLALGANVWNLGVLPAFVAAPLVARPLLRRGHEALGIVLDRGKIAADGPTRQLLADEKLLARCRLERPLSMGV